eukprot:SM000069S20689  [mRNA]  locus=s69:185200:189128:+ [translate_table: standard]
MAMTAREKVVVCDSGSGFVKCGYAGSNFPRAVFPCIVGRSVMPFEDESTGKPGKDIYIGEECANLQQQLDVSYPVANGVVQNWEDMELVWEHAFHYHLKIDASESKILLTDPLLNPRPNRERIIQIMFENFNFEQVFIQNQAILSLYAQGLLTGLVVNSGDGVTHVVAVVDGFAFPHLTKRLNIAGRHITSHLIDLLFQRGYSFSQTADYETVRNLKEQLCYISYDIKREMQLAMETTVLMKSYTLPDGRVIKVGSERFQAPEILFNPELIGVEGGGLADMVFRCIQEMDIDNRMELYQHIVLSGGTTMFPGLPTRLEKELKGLYVTHVLKGNREGMKKLRMKLEDPPGRKHMVYLGGAILADLMKDMPEAWISRTEYQEEGPRCLRKCGQP